LSLIPAVGAARRAAAWGGRHFVWVVFAAIVSLWAYTHLYPDSLGTCHHVPLSVGQKASVRDCDPWGTSDFVVPLAAALFLFFDFEELELFGLGKMKRKVKEATEVLKAPEAPLDERGTAFLETLPLGSSGATESPPPSAE